MAADLTIHPALEIRALDLEIIPKNPTSPRVEVLDALRGFALFGIILTHYLHFYYYNLLPLAVEDHYQLGINKAIFDWDYRLVVNKFYTLFCLLFGVTFAIQRKGFKAKKGSFFQWYGIRMIVLFGIGFVHHLFWKGDILITYAPLGLLLLIIDKLPKSLVLGLSVILMLGIPTLISRSLSHADLVLESHKIPLPTRLREFSFYTLEKSGNLAENIVSNIRSYPSMVAYLFSTGRLLVTLGFFLFGSYLGGTTLFSKFAENQAVFSRYFLLTSGALALILSIRIAFHLVFSVDHLTHGELILSSALIDLYNLILSLWYVFGFCCLYYWPVFYQFQVGLVPIGKLALSNYIFQSFSGLLLFFGFGLGLFMKTSALENIMLALAVFCLEIWGSAQWLKKHRQGPVEWVWRAATQKIWGMSEPKTKI